MEMRSCASTRRSRCGPCSTRHRRRVGRVAISGLHPGCVEWFLTLTAPGEDVHYLPNGERCPCTPPGGVDLAEWNATLGRRWNDFCTYVRRLLDDQALQFFKGTEVQQRGALHIHALIRPSRPVKAPTMKKLRAMAIHLGFGHAVDLQPVAREKHAWYVAKYVSKACDDRAHVPWARHGQVLDEETGELVAQLVRCDATYRPWSSSRHWGVTMRQVKAEQQRWVRERLAAAEGGGAPAAAALDTSTTRYTHSLSPPGQGVA